jgi:hypothetical protein
MPTFPPDAHLKGGRNAAPVLAELARAFYAPIVPVVLELRRQGLSLRAIAGELKRRGIKPRYGCQAGWSAGQVRRILARGWAAPAAPEIPPESQQSTACETAAPACETAAASACETPASPGPQAPPAAGSILLLIDETERGPFTSSQVEAMLDAGEITPETLFRRDGMAGWQPLQTAIAAQ